MTVMNYDADGTIYGNIFLSGGNTMFLGLADCLKMYITVVLCVQQTVPQRVQA